LTTSDFKNQMKSPGTFRSRHVNGAEWG